ncbi:MAG: MFS transporter, partial [Cohaesibacteraceae bacterium]|nr:MFS transporter [Cohaesibacteraceae bacterium]
MKNRAIKLLYLMELFSGLARGSYLGCIGWTALVLSNSVATVGQIFILQSLTMMIAGPVIGVFIDRHKRKNLIILAQFIIAFAMSGVGILLFNIENLSVYWLFCAVLIIAATRIIYRGAFSGILRGAIENTYVLRSVAQANTIHLMSTAVGMAGAGLIIDRYSTGHGFIASAVASVAVLLIAMFLDGGVVKSNVRGLAGYWQDFKLGLGIFKHSKPIQLIALLSATALPIGQLSNALLPSFIRDDLGKNSDVFGTVDAGWAIGGMAAAAVLSVFSKRISSQFAEYLLAVLAGLATIAFSFGTELIGLTVMHGLMGFFVWSCRILITGRIIELSSTENVGRVTI